MLTSKCQESSGFGRRLSKGSLVETEGIGRGVMQHPLEERQPPDARVRLVGGLIWMFDDTDGTGFERVTHQAACGLKECVTNIELRIFPF